MNVSHPIRGFVPTLDAPVLEVLAATTRGLSGREVHRLAGVGSVRGIQLVLARLVRQGLVRADEHSSMTLYVANRSHLAWPALEALVDLRGRLMQQLREAIAGWPTAPFHVSVFGSAARRDGDEDSDIDVLIVRPDAVEEGHEAWEAQIDALRTGVAGWTGNRCQALVVDRGRLSELLAARDSIVGAWLRDGILIHGQSLQAVVDDLAVAARS